MQDRRSEFQKQVDDLPPRPPARAAGPWRNTAWACLHAEHRLERPCCGGRGLCHRDPHLPLGVTGRQCNALHCPFESFRADPIQDRRAQRNEP
jgi:hypothetical protein